jgi:hypothetical protein
MLITGAMAAAGSITLIALRSIFRPAVQVTYFNLRHTALAVLASALTTGLLAPLIYQLVRRADQLRRRDEGAAAL